MKILIVMVIIVRKKVIIVIIVLLMIMILTIIVASRMLLNMVIVIPARGLNDANITNGRLRRRPEPAPRCSMLARLEAGFCPKLVCFCSFQHFTPPQSTLSNGSRGSVQTRFNLHVGVNLSRAGNNNLIMLGLKLAQCVNS